jgi:LEA14-like dessication related protein
MLPRPIRFSIAVVLLALLAGCQSLQEMAGKPSAQVLGTSLRGLSLDHAVLLFDVEVSNPYPVSLPLLDLSYALSSGGQKFLEGSIQPTGSIPAKGKQVIQLPATVRFASLGSVLKGIKPGTTVPYVANFTLAADAPAIGRVEAPFSKSGDFPIPAPPQVEVTSFEVGRLALDQSSGTVKLKVRNPNSFSLGLKRFGASVALGGVEIGGSRLSDAANLGGGETTTLSIPVSFSPRAAGASLLNLLRGKQIAYKVSGSVEANTQYGPITLPYSKVGNTAVVKP